MQELTTYQETDIQQREATHSDAIIEYIESELDGKIFQHAKKNKNTYDSYINSGKKFLEFLKQKGVSATSVEDYVNAMAANKKISENTRRARGRGAIMVIERVAHLRHDLIPNHIAAKLTSYVNISNPNVKTKREGLHPDEVAKIKAYLFNLEEGEEKRVLMVQYVLLRYQGLRASELAYLTAGDFKFKSGKVMVKRKGDSEKSASRMFTVAQNEVKKYLAFFNYTGADRLFPGADRHKVSTAWKELFKGLGIKGRALHDWRHYLGSWVAQVTNGNVFAVQDALAHKSIETCKHYIDEYMRDRAFKNLDNIVNEEE